MDTKRYIQKRIAALTFRPNWDDDPSIRQKVKKLQLELEKIGRLRKKNLPKKISGKAKTVGVFRNDVLEIYGSTAEIGEMFGLNQTTICSYAKSNRYFKDGPKEGLRFSYIPKDEVANIVKTK